MPLLSRRTTPLVVCPRSRFGAGRDALWSVAQPQAAQYAGPPSSIIGTEQHAERRNVTSDFCYTICFMCGKPIRDEPRADRLPGGCCVPAGYFGAVEAAHQDCILNAGLVDPDVPGQPIPEEF